MTCKLFKLFSRLQKKQLYEALDHQIEEAERIGKKLEQYQYKLTVDGDTLWFRERLCEDFLKEKESKGSKGLSNGTCSTPASCNVNS